VLFMKATKPMEQGQLADKKKRFDWQVAASAATVLALLVIIYQTYLLNSQFLLQKKTDDRAWAAELLLTIYADSYPTHVRAESVKAFLLLQREINPQVEVNLDDVNLADMDLQEVDFTKVSLKHANLTRANLQYATLTETNFEGGDLRGCNMSHAHLDRANLRKTRLYGVRLISSKLIEARLEGANFYFMKRTAGDPDQAGPGKTRDYGSGLVFEEGKAKSDDKEPLDSPNATEADFKGAVFDKDTDVCGLIVNGAKLDKAIGMSKEQKDCLVTSSGTTLPPD
jgi:uncharacterized protein YjbI with pentapeptide repeats